MNQKTKSIVERKKISSSVNYLKRLVKHEYLINLVRGKERAKISWLGKRKETHSQTQKSLKALFNYMATNVNNQRKWIFQRKKVTETDL